MSLFSSCRMQGAICQRILNSRLLSVAVGARPLALSLGPTPACVTCVKTWQHKSSLANRQACPSHAIAKCTSPISFASMPGVVNNEDFGHWSPYLVARRFYKRKKTIRKAPTKILNFDWGGDLSYAPFPLDETKPRLEFDDAEELVSVDDTVKKLLSLEFGDGQDKQNRKIFEILEKVKEHPLDLQSVEVKVAYQTVAIRNQMRHVLECRKDKRAKSRLVERLQSRRKHLKALRSLDFEKFTWLCDELQVEYIPVPEYNRKESKRATAKREARLAAFNIRKQKLQLLQDKFAQEKVQFEEHKAKELSAIERELSELNLDQQDPMVQVFQAVKEGRLEIEDKRKKPPPKSRRKLILEKKFELAAARKKEMESSVQT